MSTFTTVKKLWNYGNVLIDCGKTYGHYPLPAFERKPSPRLLSWAFGATMVHRTSIFSRLTLEVLGNQKGLLELILNKSHNDALGNKGIMYFSRCGETS